MTKPISHILLIAFFFFLPSEAYAATFYVDFQNGSSGGDGSAAQPWDSITTALDNVADGSLVLVKPGTYNGRVRLRGTFSLGVTVRAEIPYRSKLRHSQTVVTAYQSSQGCQGITLEGFDIAHSGPGAGALVFHIDGGGAFHVSNLVVRNNILHDSYNNDILKINNSTSNILVEGNLFYNQTGSDEHIDINSVQDVNVRDNIFMNDFAGSGRSNANNTSSYIVIKDSNGSSDSLTSSRRVTVNRNVFLNWEGSTGSNFVLIGEDGQAFFEGLDILVENNLMLGNSANVMRAPFGVKGSKNITFRHNTVVGDLPALAFAMRLNTEGSNLPNENISFYNNIWSDPTGTMGARDASSANDFSDTPAGETTSFTLNNNIYWNGTGSIPSSSADLVNYTDDAARITADPKLPAQTGIVLPRWVEANSVFNDGSTSIRQAFVRLVDSYGSITAGSAAIDAARTDQSPADDILGNLRNGGSGPDVGAFEIQRDTTPPAPPRVLRLN